jgi:hypothetical protein
LLVCNWPYSVRQNHLFVKMLYNRDFTIQKYFRDSTLVTSQKNQFPVSRPDNVSSRPDAHLSIAPASGRRAIPSGRQTDQASSFQTTWTSVRTFLYVEKLLCQLASVRTTQQPVRTTSSDRSASDSFQVQIREDCCNRLDALLLQARITIQIQ